MVVIAIIALLMAVLLPALNRAREAGKRAVCLHNLGQLMLAWNMYADDNDDKIVNAQIWKVHSTWPIPFGDTPGGAMYEDSGGDPTGIYRGQAGWAYWPHLWNTTISPSAGSQMAPHKLGGPTGGITENAATKADWQHGVACGALWRYLKDFEIYACPVGDKGAYITYTISMMMNGHYCNGWCTADTGGPAHPLCGYYVTAPYRNRSQIRNTARRMCFLDTGVLSGGSYDIRIDGSATEFFCWVNLPPLRHGKGTTLAFVDGHCEYRKWVDKQTWDTRWTASGTTPCPQNCNKDLFYMQKIVCGRLGVNEIAAIPADCVTE